MSRLIVKNLPLKITEEQVSNHFSKTGQVTDVKLKYNKDGEFRGFAFIGFDSEEAASRALMEFKNTFFKRSKIAVERCQDLDHKLEKLSEENKITNNKENSTTNDKKYFKYALKKTTEMTKEKLETLMNNPSFIQYLTLNKKGTASLVETLKKKYGLLEKKEEKEQDQSSGDEEEPQKDSLARRNISDLEYLECLKKASTSEIKKEKVKKWEKLFTVVVRTKEQNTNKDKKGKTLMKKSVRDFFKPLKFHSLRIPRGLSYVAYVGFQTEKAMNQALMMDKSFLDGVRVRVHKHEDPNSAKESHLKDAPWKDAEEKLLKEADPIGESGKLFVRNLWYLVKEEDLRKLFEEFGPLADFTLPVSQLTQKAKGFAHVSYTFPEHAVTAMNQLDGKSFQGRVLHILPSMVKDENETDEKNFKNKKKDDLKKNAFSWHNWNTLFLSSGAVIDLFSQNVNKSKYELFEEKNNESVAVNLALSETLAVEKTKRFLEEEGVSLEAFSNPNVQRSNTIILAKNLPVETTATELKQVFERYGQLGRVVLPPSGVTAIIEFVTPSEAKKAFENLAYTRFKWLPLFLEWAPIEIFKTPPPKQEKKEERHTEDKKSIPEDNTTLYVKNLNFETDEDALRAHFSKFGEISSVLIAKKRTLSQGYGFVEFVKTTDADKAMRALQNSTLDGHALTIKKSEKKLTATVKSTRQFHNPGEPTSAKILIKNIPFQATWKEVRQLFQVFGEIKLLRLPKKLGSTEHRGFGFIEFTNEDDAKKAIESLGSSTHLYGRRMVLEWAKEEETVEELRKRTAQKFLNSGPPQKKQKIDVSSQNINGGDPMDNF